MKSLAKGILISSISCCVIGAFQSEVSAQSSSARPGAASPPEIDRLSRQANEARKDGRFLDAIDLLRQALKLNERWEEGWWHLGTVCYELDLYEDAVTAFRRLAALRPSDGPTRAFMGLCEFQLRDYERALVDLQKARLLGLGNNAQLASVTRYHAAILLTRFERFEMAYETLSELAGEQKENPKIVEAMGIAILRLPFLPSELPANKRELVLIAGQAAHAMATRRITLAEDSFKHLLTRFPDTPNVHYAFGAFLTQGSPDLALEHFRRELEISPNHVPALLQMAFEYLKRANYEEALQFAQKGAELATNHLAAVAHHALGRIYLETEKLELAVKELETAVKLAPDSPEMHFALAKAYTRVGREQDAKRERAEFLRLDKLHRSYRENSYSLIEDEKPKQ